MTPQDKPHRLTCCCCGAATIGRQWHNRDTGYGLCESCAETIPKRWPGEDMQGNYGLKGYHYALGAEGAA